MANKEATARIKINKLLEAAGWRFFPEGSAPANIRLEPSVTIKSSDLEARGENFEKTTKGFIDFLLLDTKGFPLIVLEAKSEDKNPLVGKEQARKYAKSQNCRFVILSNGNLHYFWDLERGNPYLEPERPGHIQANKLRFLRPYQLKAIHALQRAVKDGKDRFLFEMATGTGKTLTAAAADRRLTLREILEKIFGLIPRFKSKDELLEEEFAKFVADTKPEEAEAIPAIKTYFKAYVTSDQVRHTIESGHFTDLATNPVFSTRDFRAVPEKYRMLVPEYIKDYVSLNQFAA
jgi:type I restriction enzyme R subunit